jgi:hypothetical protein
LRISSAVIRPVRGSGYRVSGSAGAWTKAVGHDRQTELHGILERMRAFVGSNSMIVIG